MSIGRKLGSILDSFAKNGKNLIFRHRDSEDAETNNLHIITQLCIRFSPRISASATDF